jgi:hypothetical protein
MPQAASNRHGLNKEVRSMPQLTVRGIDPAKLAIISGKLIEELAQLCECGTDYFTIDCVQLTSVFDGKTVPTFPFIEVAWFDRGQAVRDRFAETVTHHIRNTGAADLEIAFKVYTPEAYYINGKACD